jgi:hypothetical protein
LRKIPVEPWWWWVSRKNNGLQRCCNQETDSKTGCKQASNAASQPSIHHLPIHPIECWGKHKQKQTYSFSRIPKSCKKVQ